MSKKFYIKTETAPQAICFCEGPMSGYTEVTDSNKLKALYIKKYNERAQDGHNFFDDIRAQAGLDVASGTLSASDAFFIEGKLAETKTHVINGDWLTAQYYIYLVTVEGALTQAFYDNIKGYIDNYVTNNY